MLDRCPHCGSDWGVYVKQTLVNVPYNMKFDGSADCNMEMYDNAERIEYGKLVYCQQCDKVICRLSTFEERS